ncbi:MAG: DNA replication/repair protein RecF [Bacteroidota bacterium]
MHLQTLSLLNFKNYADASLQFSEKINCFVGENGVGKTNLLDAIHYLALCKSSFNPVDTQNIRFDEEFAVIQGVYRKEEKEEQIYCSIRRQKNKIFKRNKKEYQRLADHIGLFPLVMISPSDSSLITGGSEERRRFLNEVMAQFDRNYLENVILYNRALQQRNRLLKDFAVSGSFQRDLLEVWDEQLILYGEPVFRAREAFISSLLPVFREIYAHVSGHKEEVEMKYESPLHEATFRDLLALNLQKDRALQYTSAGVHKDDLVMTLGPLPLKKIGSQGQQKTLLVALKLAEFEYISREKGLKPTLLLDDLFDKFDRNRVRQIIQLVAENRFGQIFISDTNEDRLLGIIREIPVAHRIFRISRGGTVEQLTD